MFSCVQVASEQVPREERWERRDGEEEESQTYRAHTCLHSVRLLFPSMALACREVGTTGSASAERKVRTAAAAENTVPGSSLPPLSNTSWMSCSSAWRPPSVNRSSCKRQLHHQCSILEHFSPFSSPLPSPVHIS